MYRLLIAVLLATAVAGNSLSTRAAKDYLQSAREPRIIGGWNASIEDHPWQVSIQRFGKHICGGSIISEDTILTAGHCIVEPAQWIRIRVGSSLWRRGGMLLQASKMVRHENFTHNEFNVPIYDVAIIKLTTNITFNNASQPIPLFNSDEVAIEDTEAIVSGWGTKKEEGRANKHLMATVMPVITKANCQKSYKATYGKLPVGQICAGHKDGGKDTCQGDSGGPMVIDGRQAGIVSWGHGCARRGFPGVYTEIAYFRDWIKEHAGV